METHHNGDKVEKEIAEWPKGKHSYCHQYDLGRKLHLDGGVDSA